MAPGICGSRGLAANAPEGCFHLTCIVFPAILLVMGKQDKIVTAMRTNPRDWRIEQIESVAAHAGLKVRKNGGSHVVI